MSRPQRRHPGRMSEGLFTGLLSWLLLLLAACDPEPELCTLHSQCPPGQLCADGRCTPTVQQDAAPGDRGPHQERLAADLGGDGTADGGGLPEIGADGPISCQPDNDDQVARSEMVFALGVEVPYTVGGGITVDLRGVQTGGRTLWDLSAAAPDDHQETSALQALPGWAGPSFPGATYMSLLDHDLGTYGVFAATPDALQLLGVISEQPDQTRLEYSAPVDLLRFPVTSLGAYQTEADVTGTLNWMPLWLHEAYSVTVLGAGDLQLPQLRLPVLLVQVKVVQTPVNPLLATTRVTFMFVAECYGVVARVVAEGDPDDQLEAVLAAERRRLAF